jgi:hypothetical protein
LIELAAIIVRPQEWACFVVWLGEEQAPDHFFRSVGQLMITVNG